MADTVQESNFSFFPPPQDFVTAHHAFILLLFPARYTDLVHSIREKRPRVSAARRAGLFSLSLSLFLRLPQATDPFSPNLAAACFSPSTGFRPPTIRSIVILRVRCELAPTRSGDPRGERAIRYTEKGERERERESFNDRGPNRPCSPSVIFIAGQKMFSRTLWNEKSIRSFCNCSEIGRWNAEGYFWNNFVETFTGFYYVTCWWGTLIQKVSFILHHALIYIHFAHLGGKSEELFI